MTALSSFRTQVAAKLGMDNSGTNPGSLTAEQTLLHLWANAGYEYVLTESKAYVLSADLALTVGEPDYLLPAQILALQDLSMTLSTGDIDCERVSPLEILQFRRASEGGLGSSSIQRYALNGANMLMLYPTPLDTGPLTVYYVPRPTPLSLDGDVPSSIPAEWHKLIEYYMLWQGGEYTNDEPSKNGDVFKLKLDEGISKFRQAIRNFGGRSLNPTPIGRRRRPIAQAGQDTGR